jgi:hypothetical protein
MAKGTGTGTGTKKPRQSRKTVVAASPVPATVPSVPTPATQSAFIRWMFKPRSLVLAAGIASLWIFGPLAIRQLPKLEQRPEYMVGPDQVTITPPPRWIPPELVKQVFERAGFTDHESLLDETLSERVAAAFYTHPWIENVRAVRKSFPARLQVDVVYREPVAMVKGFDGHYPIDRNGVLLPPGDFSPADTERYPVIEQVSSVPQGKIGEKWGDPVVDGAAELASVLNSATAEQQSWWNKLELQAILVPRSVVMGGDVDQTEYLLRTQGGSEIHWGRAPSTLHPGELAVKQKLERLASFQKDFGGFDDSHGPYEIDIRPWNGIRRGALARESRPGSSLQ